MKSRLFTILCVVALVGACVLAYFTGNPVLDYVAIAVACAAATGSVVKFLKNPGKSKVCNGFAVFLFAASGIFGALAGLAEGVYATLATAVLAVITLIAGLIIANKSVTAKSKFD